jgi:TonB family protein
MLPVAGDASVCPAQCLPDVSARSIRSPPTTAIDAVGVQHSSSDYPKGQVPWVADLLRTPPPEYPSQESALHHVGAGRFRIALDLRSGTVVSVSVLQSTGFKAFDESAVAALSRWRWKPGRWKEINIQVRFTMSQSSLPEYRSTHRARLIYIYCINRGIVLTGFK